MADIHDSWFNLGIREDTGQDKTLDDLTPNTISWQYYLIPQQYQIWWHILKRANISQVDTATESYLSQSYDELTMKELYLALKIIMDLSWLYWISVHLR